MDASPRVRLESVMDDRFFRVGRALTSLQRALRRIARRGRGSHANAPSPDSPIAADASPPAHPTQLAKRRAKKKDPDVSVVVPVFNSAPWIDECLSSVLAQTGVDLEVICINDGSTDDSRAILQRFAEKDARVRILDQDNSGQSIGRNRGLAAARGRYVIYLDSDDYWPNDELARLVGRADGDRLDVLLFDCISFRDGKIDEKTWRRYATYYERSRAYTHVSAGAELMAEMRRGKDYKPHVGLYLTRTRYVKELGLEFIPGIVHQDNPYTFRLLINAERASHERVDAYARRIRPGSTITTLNAERSARGYFLSYIEMKRELDGRDLAESVSGEIQNILGYAYDGARKQLSQVSPEVAAGIRSLDESEDAQTIFESMLEQDR